MTSGIYKITNDRTGEVYVGQSYNIEKRWEQHKEELKNVVKTVYPKEFIQGFE